MKPLKTKNRCLEHYLGFDTTAVCWRKAGHLGKHRSSDGFEWKRRGDSCEDVWAKKNRRQRRRQGK